MALFMSIATIKAMAALPEAEKNLFIGTSKSLKPTEQIWQRLKRQHQVQSKAEIVFNYQKNYLWKANLKEGEICKQEC